MSSSLDNAVQSSPTSNSLLCGPREAKVLVIYTGGTIGMMRNKNNVLEPIPNEFVKRIRENPNLHDETYARDRFGSAATKPPLVLPYVQDAKKRIIYTIKEYVPILDSSNMRMDDWVRIANDIHESYGFFDGFVVLHGTDTLCYTASALSFMFENLGKTVVVTGSQIPIFETRTDGKDNFISALIIAGTYVIPEVCILFGSKLMRGNRTIKVSCNSFDAFDSPNFEPLARMAVKVAIADRRKIRSCSVSRFTVHSELERNVAILRLFPNITSSTVRDFLALPKRGVVLQSFGAGNVPSNEQALLDEIKAAIDRGVIIVNCTQCPNGSVARMYETGEVLYTAGVIPGYDMTAEAALTKLSFVLGKSEWDLNVKKRMMTSDLRGELTLPEDNDDI